MPPSCVGGVLAGASQTCAVAGAHGGGDGTLTPATMLGANTTITFNDEGDAVELEWIGAGGWAVISNQGFTLA